MFYITGDTHRDFRQIAKFCETMETSKDDVLIILGDTGINYYGGPRDNKLKQTLAELPVTLFCIHGNHENRPSNIPTYKEQEWNGGLVYAEEDYPSLLFGKDGEIFQLGGKSYAVLGGAYSVDKRYRLRNNRPWWEDEQPSGKIKQRAERALKGAGWQVHGVLSHTAPLSYEPREAFLPGVNQLFVDRSTEEWLDTIEKKLTYQIWYCGHYHINKDIDKLVFLFDEIREL